MILWFQNKVDVLEYHSVKVRSAREAFQLPSVLRLRKYVRPHYSSVKVKLSRQNLFLRDQHTCLYCGDIFPEKVLTVDHIMPVSRGGKHEWTNVATSCGPCNNKKGNMTPKEAEMPLRRKPMQPKWLPTKEFAYKNSQKRPTSWEPYLSHLKK